MQFIWNVNHIECGVIAHWLLGVLVAKVKEEMYPERVGIGNPFEGCKWHSKFHNRNVTQFVEVFSFYLQICGWTLEPESLTSLIIQKSGLVRIHLVVLYVGWQQWIESVSQIKSQRWNSLGHVSSCLHILATVTCKFSGPVLLAALIWYETQINNYNMILFLKNNDLVK